VSVVVVFSIHGHSYLHFFAINAAWIILDRWRPTLYHFLVYIDCFSLSESSELAHNGVLVIASVVDENRVEEVSSDFVCVDEDISDSSDLNFLGITGDQIGEIIESEFVVSFCPRRVAFVRGKSHCEGDVDWVFCRGQQLEVN
jgi:hypothetical protein